MFQNSVEITFTSAHASADLEVPHSLNTVPTDVLVGVPSANAVVYRGVTSWTRDNVYFRSSAACVVRIYFMVV